MKSPDAFDPCDLQELLRLIAVTPAVWHVEEPVRLGPEGAWPPPARFVRRGARRRRIVRAG
jgi:hypothetical protein